MSVPAKLSILDRFGDAFAALVQTRAGSAARYFGTYGYRVVAQSGNRIDCEPDDNEAGLPPHARTTLRPAIDGAMPQLLPGTSVLLIFVNGDPSRPVIIGGDPTTAPASVDLPATVTNIKGQTNCGALPQPVALAAATLAAFEACATAYTSIATWATATNAFATLCTGPTAPQKATYATATTTCTGAMAAAEAALVSAAPLTIPAVETNAT